MTTDTDLGAPVVWTPVADRYLPTDLTERFLTAAARSRWVPADGEHPMMPALGLRQIIPAMGVRGVREVAYSESWEVHERDFTWPTGYEHPDMIGAYTILAWRTDDLTFFALDLGTGIVPVVMLDRQRDGAS